MRHSIRRQFAVIFILLLAGTIGLCWFINSTFLENFYMSQKEKKIEAAYDMINAAAGGSMSFDVEALQELTDTCFQDNIVAVVISPTNSIIYTSPNGGGEFLLSLVRFRGGAYSQIVPDEIGRFSYENSSTEYVGKFGTLDNGNSYLIATPLESIRESVSLANRFLGYVGICMIIIGGIIIWVVTKKITDPILELADITDRISHLDFDAKYHGKSHNEIAFLGENINKVSDSLQTTISELKTANNELRRDIEKKEQMEEMRTDFISNVSHELKNPIALIQGYAEGLQEGVNDPESTSFYCDVIVDEAEKMNRMVRELLTLNELEYGEDVVTMERFDIVELINTYIQSEQIMIKQAEIDVRMTQSTPIYVWGDEFKIEEVFTNYFSNAVNHCESGKSRNGGKVIDIRVEDRSDKVRVCIFNTGTPIPEDALPHLWEKFYKVDKARSREYGGSGVGLSIVKIIMDSHNQDYGVTNFTNGVMFWFELEKVEES